ncbi:hypothetical protein AgCh_029274 [Apium graveolens]
MRKFTHPIKENSDGSKVTTFGVSSPEMDKQLLRKNEKFLLSRAVPVVVSVQPNLKATIGWAATDQWWNSRRKVMNANPFTSQKLNDIEQLMHRKGCNSFPT